MAFYTSPCQYFFPVGQERPTPPKELVGEGEKSKPRCQWSRVPVSAIPRGFALPKRTGRIQGRSDEEITQTPIFHGCSRKSKEALIARKEETRASPQSPVCGRSQAGRSIEGSK